MSPLLPTSERLRARAEFERDQVKAELEQAVERARKAEARSVQQLEEATSLLRLIDRLKEENARLKRGEFSPEEFQALCHHRDEKPGCTAEDFYEGCALYQRKLFGRADRDPEKAA